MYKNVKNLVKIWERSFTEAFEFSRFKEAFTFNKCLKQDCCVFS